MSTRSLTRLAGLVVLLAGAAVILFNIALLPGILSSRWEYPGYLVLNVLLVFALTALYTRHLNRSSILLHLGYLLSAVSLFLSIGFAFYASFAFPILNAQFPEAVKAVLNGPISLTLTASMILGLVGNLSFFMALLLAREIPRWVTVILLVGAVTSVLMLPYNIPAIITSAGMIGAGLSMLANPRPVAVDIQTPA